MCIHCELLSVYDHRLQICLNQPQYVCACIKVYNDFISVCILAFRMCLCMRFSVCINMYCDFVTELEHVFVYVTWCVQVCVSGTVCVCSGIQCPQSWGMLVREQQVRGWGGGCSLFTQLHLNSSGLLGHAAPRHCFSRAHPFSSLCSFIKAHSNQHDSPLCTFRLQTGMKTGH